MFVSYSYNALHNGTFSDSGFDNMLAEDWTIEPKDEESLYDLQNLVENDLKGRIGYEAVHATILWWKLL